MLDAHMMKCANNRPLQETPDALYGVGVNVSPDKFILGVVDRLMPGVMVTNASIDGPFISKDGYSVGSDVLQGDFVESLSGPICRYLEYHFPPFDYSHHQSLVALVAPALPFCFAANKGLVHFNDAGHQYPFFPVSGLAHSSPDSVAQVPGSLVGNVKGALKLVGRHALLGLTHHVDRNEP